jgi:hypothetical protein
MGVSRVAVRAFSIALVALGATACLPENSPGSSGTPAPHESPTPLTSSSPSPSATISPSPSPSESEPSGPITGAPVGTPVTPEIFMATIDEEGGVLRVVVMVPGIYEDGGLCTVTAEGHASTSIKYQYGVADVSSTACGEFTFSLEQLGSGTATVTADYQSSKHSGTSEATEVTIP